MEKISSDLYRCYDKATAWRVDVDAKATNSTHDEVPYIDNSNDDLLF